MDRLYSLRKKEIKKDKKKEKNEKNKKKREIFDCYRNYLKKRKCLHKNIQLFVCKLNFQRKIHYQLTKLTHHDYVKTIRK